MFTSLRTRYFRLLCHFNSAWAFVYFVSFVVHPVDRKCSIGTRTVRCSSDAINTYRLKWLHLGNSFSVLSNPKPRITSH